MSSQNLPVRNDMTAAMGEKVEFCVSVEGDIVLDYAVANFTLKADSSDGEIIKQACLNFVDKKAFVILTPEDTKDMGEGLFYYDVWLKDGADLVRPIVYGALTILKLPTVGGCE